MSVSTNKYTNIDKVVKTAEIFNAKILGDFIPLHFFKKKINNINNYDFEDIIIVFNNYNDSEVFIRLLRNIFEVYTNNNSNYIIFLNHNNEYIRMINLYIYYDENITQLYNYYCLDINSLYLSSTGINIIQNKYIDSIDNLQITINRISEKKFSLIDDYDDNILDIYDKCIQLLHKDWIMDDKYLKKNSSVLFKWNNKNNDIRLYHNENERNNMNSQNVCSICSNEFKEHDIVVNTKCNHNFHWNCDNSAGIKNWIINYSHKCPICRCNYCI